MHPVQVNKSNEEEVWHHLYDDQAMSYKRPKFKVGDCVQISYVKKTFERDTYQIGMKRSLPYMT